jgi:H+/Cl- antiporter ClcA
MQKSRSSFEQFSIVSNLLKWTVLVIPVSAAVGSIVALFLWMLEKATSIRWQDGWFLFLLPIAGVLIYFLYKLLGEDSERGNNLIMEEIHEPGGGVPFRMTPLVFITTIITHLFGGSAGREGTAVQMGGSIAGLFAKWFQLDKEDVRILLMTGVAAGFGAVFGTPLAGAIFALEVLIVGKLNYKALLPCFMASILADIACRAWGIEHTQYTILSVAGGTHLFSLDIFLLIKVIVAGIAFGLASYFFSELSHAIKYYSNQFIPIKWLIPVIGGCIIIALTFILGTRDYLGLGVTNPNGGVSIVSCFKNGGAYYFSWFWKLLFTAITLSMGFKGGEVTPLFFIGAALGNTIGLLTGAPVDLMAGLGFIAVFAGATNTPIACTIMGVELFGGEHILYYAIACFTAYYFSGHSGIYSAQRLGVSKHHSKSD